MIGNTNTKSAVDSSTQLLDIGEKPHGFSSICGFLVKFLILKTFYNFRTKYVISTKIGLETKHYEWNTSTPRKCKTDVITGHYGFACEFSVFGGFEDPWFVNFQCLVNLKTADLWISSVWWTWRPLTCEFRQNTMYYFWLFHVWQLFALLELSPNSEIISFEIDISNLHKSTLSLIYEMSPSKNNY